ncbi:MAG: hypothetical protein RLZZ46_1333 [Bacteroidota bacterium]|jgi:putative hydrolase of the HAD superfamily
MYKDLFFDLDHTLWDFEKNSRETLLEAFERFGLREILNASFDDFLMIYEGINHHLWERYRAGEISREFLRNHRFESVFSNWSVSDRPLVEAVSDYYVANSPRKVGLIDGVHEVLTILQKKYRLHIITNGFNEVQFTKISHSGLALYFTEIITSEIAGVNKPHYDIFRHAISLTGAMPASSLMIGDHWEADIRGAANFGMDQVWFNPQGKEVPEPAPTYSIRTLKELIDFL